MRKVLLLSLAIVSLSWVNYVEGFKFLNAQNLSTTDAIQNQRIETSDTLIKDLRYKLDRQEIKIEELTNQVSEFKGGAEIFGFLLTLISGATFVVSVRKKP